MVKKNNIEKIYGFNDKFSEDLRKFSYMRERFLDFSEKWGYMEISPPIIENSDLFKRKSGETFVSDLYQFSDPSGMNVSLRPEYTSSIMRMVIEEDMYELDQDLRFSYSGEIYRYDRKSKKNYIMQNGIEIIGNNNPITDTEIIALSYLFSKEILGQNPLISVGNIANILVSPPGNIHKKLTKLSLEILGEPFLPFIYGQVNCPFATTIRRSLVPNNIRSMVD